MFSKQIALIADDSVQTQRIVTHILKDDLHFHHVFVASNGKLALDIFEKENIDWIFSDWEMPVMGGNEFVTALRKHPRGHSLPIVLMTGYANKETLAAAIVAGVTDFIAKPFSPAILTQKVRRIAAAVERRVAARIVTKGENPARIAFANGAKYPAQLVDISHSGCLLRASPLKKGGTVCDQATLTLQLGAKAILVSAITIRIAADHQADKPSTPAVLVAFQFQADEETQNAINLFIAQQQAMETDETAQQDDLIF